MYIGSTCWEVCSSRSLAGSSGGTSKPFTFNAERTEALPSLGSGRGALSARTQVIAIANPMLIAADGLLTSGQHAPEIQLFFPADVHQTAQVVDRTDSARPPRSPRPRGIGDRYEELETNNTSTRAPCLGWLIDTHEPLRSDDLDTPGPGGALVWFGSPGLTVSRPQVADHSVPQQNHTHTRDLLRGLAWSFGPSHHPFFELL